jgi:hypothetical protein
MCHVPWPAGDEPCGNIDLDRCDAGTTKDDHKELRVHRLQDKKTEEKE